MGRVYSIDYIKFFAILAVVVIHTTSVDTQLGLILNALSRFSVPFFFVASGYFIGLKLINSTGTSECLSYVKSYIFKLVKIYGWCILFYVWYDTSVLTLVNIQNGTNILQGLADYFKDSFSFLNVFYYGTVSSGYQLWFLPSLFWSVLILYSFYRIGRINLLMIISLVLNVVGLFGQAYAVLSLINITFSTLDTLFFGLFYTTLGFYFAKYYPSLKVKLSNSTLITLIIAFFTTQVVESIVLNSPSSYFISTIFLTISIFLFALNNRSLGKNSIISRIGAHSLGIYILHVFIISVINLGLDMLNVAIIKEMVIIRILYTPFIFAISYLTYFILQKIKQMIIQSTGKKGEIITTSDVLG
ncbi:acyltransferase [Paenibacillus sp. sgz500958]|uniref:acyltransferase n=1 Tax=Paenibacillus sp. sgz500958 TaxID=3242475 RepID=UPI0036D3F891